MLLAKHTKIEKECWRWTISNRNRNKYWSRNL